MKEARAGRTTAAGRKGNSSRRGGTLVAISGDLATDKHSSLIELVGLTRFSGQIDYAA